MNKSSDLTVSPSQTMSSTSSDDEVEACQNRKLKPWRRKGTFRFMDLPGELRRKVYILCLRVDETIDLSLLNIRRIAPRLRMLCTCRQMYEESWPIFYGQNKFQLFPTDQQFTHTSEILLRRIPSKYRNVIQNIELRLGPSWTGPPVGWTVKPRNKLRDLVSLRTLNIMVEIDPSQPIFEGFRVDVHFYTNFCARLLKGILDQVPSIQKLDFDGNPSVQVGGDLMKGLLYVARNYKKEVSVGLFGRAEPIPQWHLETVLNCLPLDEHLKANAQFMVPPVDLIAV